MSGTAGLGCAWRGRALQRSDEDRAADGEFALQGHLQTEDLDLSGWRVRWWVVSVDVPEVMV